MTGEENSGARFNKYPPGRQSEAKYGNNDWLMYRLTDIYFYKAEALMHKNGGAAVSDAVQLINNVHSRAFRPTDVAQEAYADATGTSGQAGPRIHFREQAPDGPDSVWHLYHGLVVGLPAQR